MNRSALNTAVIGSGNALPWIVATATQALRLVSTATVGLTKYGSAAGSMAVTGALRVTQYVRTSTSNVSLSLGASMPGTVWRAVRASVGVVLRAFIAGSGHTEKYASGGSSLVLSTVATPRKLTAVHVADGITLAVVGAASGSDIYTGPAAEERTTAIVEIKTQETAAVNIGGA